MSEPVVEFKPRRKSLPPKRTKPLTGWGALMASGVIAAFSLLLLGFGGASPMSAGGLGALVSGAYLYGYLRLNPRLVGIELTLFCVAGYLMDQPVALAWLAGSGMAGAVGALLCGGGAREDHHFFLPPLTALAFFALVYTAADGSEGGNALLFLTSGVDTLASAMEEALQLPENREMLEEIGSGESLTAVAHHLALLSLSFILFVWLLFLWLVTHLVRHRTGRSLRLRETLLLFRIRTAYTFLLIGALVLEILSVWLEQERLRLASYPLFSICAAGFWLVYLGILLFLLALGRVAARNRPQWGLRLLALAAFALSIYVGPFIGLADVWFDFRKMRQIRTPMP